MKKFQCGFLGIHADIIRFVIFYKSWKRSAKLSEFRDDVRGSAKQEGTKCRKAS